MGKKHSNYSGNSIHEGGRFARRKKTETSVSKSSIVENKVSFGFYSSLLVFVVFVIFFSRSLYFVQSYIITLFPTTEFYLSYFFENIRNIFEIWKNLIINY